MDRSIVLVDAGYLLGAALSTAAGRSGHGTTSIKYPELLGGLTSQAEERTGVPTLRVYWYSPWPETHSGADLRTLQQLPNVKVRLGAAQGEVNDQAGVSTPLQRDLITLARNHAVSDAVLLTADENLVGAIEEAQAFGIRVHLWGVQSANGNHGQSHTMVASADCRIVISSAWVSQHVDLLPTAVATDYSGEPHTPIIEPSVVEEIRPTTDLFGQRADSTPKNLPKSRRAERRSLELPEAPSPLDRGPLFPEQSAPEPAELESPSWSLDPMTDSVVGLYQASGDASSTDIAGWSIDAFDQSADPAPWETGPAVATDDSWSSMDSTANSWSAEEPAARPAVPVRSDTIMRLAELTSDAQASIDRHEDANLIGLSVDEVGYRFGMRWASRTSADQLDALLARYTPPSLPRKLATELDDYASLMGIDNPQRELTHHALALAFWAALTPAASGRYQ